MRERRKQKTSKINDEGKGIEGRTRVRRKEGESLKRRIED